MTSVPSSTEPIAVAELSPWWGRGVLFTLVFGFSVLILIAVTTYRNVPPIPNRAVTSTGTVLFTGEDIASGQEVFLRYGLMDNGSVWGHGGYLGPDFSASYLHDLAVDVAEQTALARFGRSYAALADEDESAVAGIVASRLRRNGYDPSTGVLVLAVGDHGFFDREQARWALYFEEPSKNGGLRRNAITDKAELHALNAFFAWAAWASVAERPGTDHSYTNNFPYDRLAGNAPTASTLVWSAVSIIFLLGATGLVLLAFGFFSDLGWHGIAAPAIGALQRDPVTPNQRAILKLVIVAALLFLAQVVIGGAVAHYRAEPGDFYGFDLSTVFPSNLVRTWHLQLAIFWIATSFVAGALFVGSLLGRWEQPGCRLGVNILVVLMAIDVFGSLLGEWVGMLQWLPTLWFWIGHQGWEYLELGRLWQVLLLVALGLWFWLLCQTVKPCFADPVRRPFAKFLLLAAAAIPLFYVPALFFASRTHFAIVDMWRFWIAHLWLEGFFELFVTVIVSIIFYQLALVSRSTALKTIYLDLILYFAGGVIGTGHHLYFSGQTDLNMALAASFSALEVVPLTLISLEAWPFIKMTRLEDEPVARHKWTFYFLMSVGFWNFLGAGVFGFLINLPIVSYFEVGTILTPNHAHTAMMGVFGMLSVGLMAFIVRELVGDESWPRIARYFQVAFWGLNGGLAAMFVLSLFPAGFMQLMDVAQNGYWHARSLAYTGSHWPQLFEWFRLPGDVVFIVFGAVPVVVGVLIAYAGLWTRRATAAPAR